MAKAAERFLQLELDAGNTRLKWRLRQREQDQHWQTLGSGVVMAPEKIPSVFLELRDQFADLPLRAIDRVLVANVRGEGFKTAFSAFLSEKLQLSASFVAVCRDGVAVQHCYADNSRLGVDRWLAMQAGYARCRAGCLVVNCGTTLTVDLVDAAGQHLGGYIVPGLWMMRESLTARSAALVIDKLPWDTTQPGCNTSEAIHHGILALVSGFLRDLRQRVPLGLAESRWLLTGGDAVWVRPQLDWPVELVPDLVLDGLELVPSRA
ncbi:MAG: type III pantothenate kinase [Pseudomonadales bacterium]|jgi:type III pantothenate kinase|nr:type III pantothenate kinase [Pseudomonadales bacterium]